jgi:hypothetical protein
MVLPLLVATGSSPQMARAQSPGYPNMSLPKAIQAIKKIHEADRRNPIDREVAVKHMGYSGSSGAADKSLASLIHYGLLEKYGKGEVRVTALAVDILHPAKAEDRTTALVESAFRPQIFADLRERFGFHVSEEALRSYLVREDFLDRAIMPVIHGYLETCRYLEQEKVFESGGGQAPSAPESHDEDGDLLTVFGGAKVGDLVQWEINGALQMERPMRVRLVTDDGKWAAVEGSETGIPMDQVIVQERSTAAASPAPTFKIDTQTDRAAPAVVAGETEWMRNRVGRETSVRLLVSGTMGAKEIGKLITLLEAQRAVLDDDEEEADRAAGQKGGVFG